MYVYIYMLLVSCRLFFYEKIHFLTGLDAIPIQCGFLKKMHLHLHNLLRSMELQVNVKKNVLEDQTHQFIMCCNSKNIINVFASLNSEKRLANILFPLTRKQ